MAERTASGILTGQLSSHGNLSTDSRAERLMQENFKLKKELFNLKKQIYINNSDNENDEIVEIKQPEQDGLEEL